MRLNRYGEVATNYEGAALGAYWLTDEAAIFQQPIDGAWQMAVRPRSHVGRGGPIDGVQGGCNALAAGGGRWMRRLDGAVPPLTGSESWRPPNGRVGDIDRDGHAVALSEDALTLYLDGDILRRDDVQGETRIMGDYVSWTSRGRVRVLDVRRRTEIDVQQVGEGAAKALAFLGPDHQTVWVLYQTDAMGGVLHPMDDASQGYRYGPASIGPGTEGIYDPDVLLREDGSLLIAWAAREGQFREDLRTAVILNLGVGMVPLELPVEPPIPPPPPVESIPVELPASILATIRRLASVYPTPRGEPGGIDEACRQWTERVCQQVRHDFPDGHPELGGEWGWKRASDTRPLSKETLALREGQRLHGWDLLRGVGTGAPTLNARPDYHDLIAEGPQVFVPVPPVNHLGDAVDTTHPRLSAPLWGQSAFDLFAAFAAGDYEYYDAVICPAGLVPRIVVASIWEGGPNNRRGRTMAQGRKQLYEGLRQLRDDGVRCEVTLLCDTAEYAKRDGLTREGAIEHVELCNAAMCVWPEAVAAVRIGNENSHGVEAPWMTDPAFLRECAALIDPRFPVSFGAGHGGEPVMVGGSYASHHADRSLSPEENGRIMAAAQQTFGVQVVDGEPLGITEPERVAGRQRTADPDYARRLAQAARDNGLGGCTLHLDSGIGCHMAEHGPVHQAALTTFLDTIGVRPTPPEDDVTTEQIAQVIAGAYFEDISRFLVLGDGPEASRRPAIHTWITQACADINQVYRDVFSRECDLEGYGSSVLALLRGASLTEFRAAKQAAYDAGAR